MYLLFVYFLHWYKYRAFSTTILYNATGINAQFEKANEQYFTYVVIIGIPRRASHSKNTFLQALLEKRKNSLLPLYFILFDSRELICLNMNFQIVWYVLLDI